MSYLTHIIVPDSRTVPLAHLSDNGEDVVVFATMVEERPEPRPLRLPPIPQSLVRWLACLGDRFRQSHGRCLAALLLLDVRSATWSAAVPAQLCGRTASSWPDDLLELPNASPEMVIAGSFQTRVLSPGETPLDCPPPHDGLHLVRIVGSARQATTICGFITAGTKTRPVPAGRWMVDDLQAVIDQALPKLTLL